MAEIGISKLQAVQEMMRAAGYGIPSSIPGSADGSDEGNAEAVLDQIIEEGMVEGFEGTVRRGILVQTADIGGSVYKAAVPSGVVGVHCLAPGRFAGRITTRDGFLYATHEGTDTFTANDVFYCDLYDTVDWTDLDPGVRQALLAKAVERFVRHYRYDPNKAQKLSAESTEASYRVDRPGEGDGTPKRSQFVPMGGRGDTPS